jgi:hypothetical protein
MGAPDLQSAVVSNPTATLSRRIHLSFSLTPLQIVLNPWERLVVTALAVLLVLCSILLIGFALWNCDSVWDALLTLVVIPGITVIGIALLALKADFFFFPHFIGYINNILISDSGLIFGSDNPGPGFGGAVPLDNLIVTKGLRGTMMIRRRRSGFCLVLPREAIPFAELKALVESKRTNELPGEQI